MLHRIGLSKYQGFGAPDQHGEFPHLHARKRRSLPATT